MTYGDAVQFLQELQWFGTTLGLETPRALAALAGRPQDRLRFVHVAGTNGKGSVCAMLESIYRAAGLRVGLFTSPHLVSFRERLQVDRHWITEAELVCQVEALHHLLAQGPASIRPTFFEAVTILALQHFAAQECDLVIWETGLGGRLDATNIVTPLASVITNIQFDHQQWLGHTLEEIAREKAGIIKPGVPVCTSTDAPEALAVIQETARRLGAPWTLVTQQDADAGLAANVALPLAGDHQRVNAALALATVQALAGEIPVPDAALRRGLETVEWAGRLQLIHTEAGRTLLIDGAHNPAGAEALRAAVEKYFPQHPRALVLGLLQDKDVAGICRTVAPLAESIAAVRVESSRAAAPESIAELCRAAHPPARVTVAGSIAAALAETAGAPLTIITGSLHFIGQVLETLGAAPRGMRSERVLNEWDAKRSECRPRS